jgi:hypothetical protein
MDELELMIQERRNVGTSWTRNEGFERNGYLVIKNLFDPQELYHSVPVERGQINYYGSVDRFDYQPEEQQVNGSLARYNHPMYRRIHNEIRLKLEAMIGRKLYNTYYYDRFYFSGQELKKHADRDACEISVTFHISTNLKEEWPIWIKTPDTYTDDKKTEVLVPGENRSVVLAAGDAMVYKGCERPHWRDPMPVGKRGLFSKREELYYHQIFFHYVLQDGYRSHYAFDAVK